VGSSLGLPTRAKVRLNLKAGHLLEIVQLRAAQELHDCVPSLPVRQFCPKLKTFESALCPFPQNGRLILLRAHSLTLAFSGGILPATQAVPSQDSA